MANHVSHAALPFPIKGARYTIGIPFLDADGDPTDPTTPDTERSIDGGAFTDCTEEVTTVSTGYGYITLTGDEMNCSLLMVNFKSASGPKFTPVIIYPRILPSIESSTASGGSSSSITLETTFLANLKTNYTGCIVRTSSGTGGGGGSGSQGNQARLITGYNPSTREATVSPNWETAPDNTTGYEIYGGTFVSGIGINGIAPLAFADNAISASAIATDAVTEIQNGLALSSQVDDLESMLGTPSDLGSGATVSANLVDIENQVGGLDAAGVRAAVGLASANLDTQLGDIPTAIENADALLKRDWTAISGEAEYSVLKALRFLRNKWAIVAALLTIYKEDGSTTSHTMDLTTNSSSDPVTGVEPN